MRNLSLFSVLALPLLLGAAASHAAPDAAPAKAPAAAPAPAAPADKVVGPPEVAWKDMTKDQRGRYMKSVVTPKMKVVFQEFDASEFKKFDCSTCHGKEAKARKFKMPSPEIMVLPGTPEAFGALMKEKPHLMKMTKFMGEKVKPQMAALLGLSEFDPKKAEAGGFGCQNCHTIKSK